MTDYGIKIGYYKFSNNDNDNGTIVEVLKATPKFVWCEFYKYFNNIINIDIFTRIQHHHISGKKKKIIDGGIYIYDWKNYNFSDGEYTKHIDGFDTKEEPVEPVVDPKPTKIELITKKIDELKEDRKKQLEYDIDKETKKWFVNHTDELIFKYEVKLFELKEKEKVEPV